MLKTMILGKTGLKVTLPSMGCLPVQRCSTENAVKLLQAAYEGGIRFFDTAAAYSDSEEKIGLALADVRNEIVLATKSHGSNREEILADIKRSLSRMKTDHIDLFQFHQLKEVPDFTDPNGIYCAALEAKEHGWIDHIGFTSHRVNIAEACIDSGIFETCQFPFSYISSERDLALADRCKEKNMGFIAMKGLAGGLLTNVNACQAFMNEFENVVPIWGIQRTSELEQWLRVANEEPLLNDDLKAFIEKEKNELAGSFCRSCGYCMPCTVGIEISNCARMNMLLRRSPWQQYMTDTWYQKMQKINDCIGCGSCSSKCPYGLDTPNLLKYMLQDYNEFYASHKNLL